MKESEDGKSIVLRIWNISDKEQESTFKLGFDVISVKYARMDEIEDKSLKIEVLDRNAFKTEIPSRRVATFLIEPE